MTVEIAPTPGAEILRAIELLEMVVPGCANAAGAVITGPPPTKARARFTKRGGVYHPGENRAAEARTAWHLKRLCPQPMTGNVAIACIFYRPNRQRADVDNMLKHVCDAANKVLWLDDSQVTAIVGIVELDVQEPRTVVAFGPHASSLVRDTGAALICDECGAPFAKGSKPQRLCSRACQIAAQRKRNRAAATLTKTPCEVCGGSTSKPGVKRCRTCWRRRGEDPEALDRPGVRIEIRAIDSLSGAVSGAPAPGGAECAGRTVDDTGQPVGDPCGRRFYRESPFGELAEVARAAGWSIAGPPMCPTCRRPDPAIGRDLTTKGPQ